MAPADNDGRARFLIRAPSKQTTAARGTTPRSLRISGYVRLTAPLAAIYNCAQVRPRPPHIPA